jgi:endonuclease-3
MKSIKTKEVYRLLQSFYPNVKSSLNFTNPIECWSAVVLSAQCTDKRVNTITPDLFEKYKDLNDYANADMQELIKIIKPCGYFNSKSTFLILGAKKLKKLGFNDTLPKTLEGLTSIPGIGQKTANVILSNVHNINLGIAIDTHNKRIFNRLGIVNTNDPIKIEKEIMKLLPQESWKEISLLMVEHGRYFCKSRSPNCSECFLKNHCDYYKNKNA